MCIEISKARFHFLESENSQISFFGGGGGVRACGIDWKIPYFQGKLGKKQAEV